MSTISATVHSALSALNAYSVAISVTNTNIANVETSGYSRQTAVIKEKTSANGIGTGVDVSAIERAYDSFLTLQLRSANQELGKSSVEVKVLTSIEQVFADTEDSGLSVAMSEFWNAWQDVVNDPSGSTTRSVLASAADTLADTFNGMSSELSDIAEGIEDSLIETVEKINELIRQIADENQNLVQLEASGQDANTCKDNLDSLVLELSSLVDINTSSNDAGQISIQLSKGKPLVEGNIAWSLSTEKNWTTGLMDVTWVDSAGDSTVVTDTVSSGELGGYLEVREELASYQDQLDELAVAIMAQINALHTSGYDVNGDEGVSFFTGPGAGDMAVNSEIISDSGKIAAASTADGGSGDGSNAVAIAELQNKISLNSETSTFSDYYDALVSKIGASVQSTESGYESLSNAQEYYTNQCLSVSAVSLDEELAKLTLYQNAYDAAAKMMTVLDEMMESLIAM